MRDQLSIHLGKLGYQLIRSLLLNFEAGSYLHLQPGMDHEKVYKRLVVVDVLMNFIAQQFSDSVLSSIVFNNHEFQGNLAAYLDTVCIFGQHENSFTINNMLDVKHNIERRLRQNQIIADAKFIFKCGPACDYLFYFEGCGRPVDKGICKICGSEIGASSYNVLLQRPAGQPQQLKMSIDEGLKYIDKCTREFEGKDRKGYILNPVNENAKIDTKLNLKPVTYRTLHFLFHSLVFGLFEAGFISKAEINKIVNKDGNTDGQQYFRAHFLQDYQMLQDLLGTKESYIWIYRMIAGFEGIVREKGRLTNAEALVKFERSFEDNVVIPVIQSINTTIQQYRQAYIEYNKDLGDEDNIAHYVDELKKDDVKYPFTQYFNFMKFPTFEDFKNQFALVVGDVKAFPLLDFVLTRHEDLVDISALPKIVSFSNYLMKKYNYQISRDKASTTLIKDLFEEDDSLKKRFEEFKDCWNRLSLKTVRVDCQEKKFQKVSEESPLSLFLPNVQKDESGILLVGTMIALATLQNELVYVSKKAMNPHKSIEEIIEDEKNNMDIVQTVHLRPGCHYKQRADPVGHCPERLHSQLRVRKGKGDHLRLRGNRDQALPVPQRQEDP